MKNFIRAGSAVIYVLSCSVYTQPSLEGVEKFQDQVLRPAMEAAFKNDLQEARRLTPAILVEFEKLPAIFQAGQVGDLHRLSRLYMEKGLFAEAESLLSRAVSAWEGPMMNTPFSPLGPLYADLAKARRLAGKPNDTDALLKRAQALRGAEPTSIDPDAFPIYVEIAEVRRLRGDLEGAETLLRKMIGFADQMKGWEFVPNLMGMFEGYATLLEQTGRAADARRFRSRADTIRKNYSKLPR